MLPSRLTICHRTVQSSRIQAAPVERVERILTSEVLLSTRSLSLFPPCRTTINLRCWPMLYTPSEKLPQHARTRGEDVSLGTGIMLPRSRTLSRKVFRTLLCRCWIDDRCAEDGSRRAVRLVTVRFINRLVFVLVGPSPLPRSSLLEDDDDDENLKKRTSPFCPSREQSVEQVLGSGISIVIVSCLREISRNKNRDRIAMKLFHACVGWFEERIGERVGDTITREMGVSWLVKRGYLHEFLLYIR